MTTTNTEIPFISEPITLTESAAQSMLSVMEEEGLVDHCVRIAVIGGGCSGLQYFLDFTEGAKTEQDLEYKNNGVKIVVDCFSAAHLKGTEIDYADGISGTGFKFNNPNIVRKCGCGMSFS